MEYIIAQGNSLELLVSRVTNFIGAGFTPLGGVSISYSRSGGFTAELYCQAMTKETKKETKSLYLVK